MSHMLCVCVLYIYTLLYSAVSIAGLLVMVSSELVVLLIVCVGINTGSAQQGELKTELIANFIQVYSKN